MSSALIIFNRIDSAVLIDRFTADSQHQMVKGKTLRSVTSSLYFDLPTQAVPVLRNLLTARDWSNLARYYNLARTGLKRDDLMSSEFYLPSIKNDAREFPAYEPPFVASRPFPADFLFERVQVDPDEKTHVVYMSRDLKSSDGYVARALSRFSMAKSPKGFQIVLAPTTRLESVSELEPPPLDSPWSALKKPKRLPKARQVTP